MCGVGEGIAANLGELGVSEEARMEALSSSPSRASSREESSRRDFLYLVTAATAGVGAAATMWPLIDQMKPDASTVAASGPIEINLKALEPGQQIVALWSARPVFIVNRTKAA